MTDFLRLVAEWIQYLWPFRRVRRYERALYTAWGGRWQWEVGPGIWPMVPWFTEVNEVAVSKGIVSTPRIDITLQDGRLLSCGASAIVRVANLDRAVNAVDSFMESGQELLHAVLADKLSDVDAERLEPKGRRRLVSDLRRWVNEQAEEFGLEFEQLRFTTWVINPRPYRVLSDGANVAPW
jgi:regulator of protease activity HflC (stomatin/prohibitin superfamily)